MKKLLLIGILSLFILQAPFVHAQQTATPGQNLGYTPLEPIPGVTVGTNGTALDFPHLLGSLYTIGITIGALLAVLMLTIGGIQYMVSEAVPNKMGGLRRAQNALWGILIIAASWLILNTVNPQLLSFNLNPCPQGNCTVSATNNPFANAPTGSINTGTGTSISSFVNGLGNNNNAPIMQTGEVLNSSAGTPLTLQQNNGSTDITSLTQLKATCQARAQSTGVSAGVFPVAQPGGQYTWECLDENP